MKSVAFLYLLFSISTIYAQKSTDAVKHLGAGIVIGGVGGYAAYKISNGQRGWTWAGAVGSSLAAGLAKEAIYDKPKGAEWETRDVVFTTLGGMVSALVLEVFTGNDGGRRGRSGSGKKCGCLVAELEFNQELDLPIFVEKGTGDITSELQAAYILR
ncbi:hypothetical protein [uncultured Maribacter sp.]|uniref:hypothetical protein n=1 Tax=uncultured Maribacter sp. TaxID=431308 RepID=UPI0030D8639B|tara:strand:+ start:1143 stop:1613 length:471 start_codon:yes stop_codon:yes gene_type:complete